MSAPAQPTGYATPEEAAAAVRNGRLGYLVTVRNDAARWIAYPEALITREGARATARSAMLLRRDPAAVAVVAADGQRLHVPAPRAALQKGGPAR